ncbi:hypothetical protein OOU_Y34scaffold00763g9 [Pyricularia oryzae Y34]|uniref:Uncharacterized protein n=1 Tax=Pyricularia oryzae (strain Y34) TaxID=1143189 RepID=A0AA97PHB2_PYRO3|nr:hypothetical protein OOU_Y34scaffold00763g9 [Pyricularia oryzae Y34]
MTKQITVQIARLEKLNRKKLAPDGLSDLKFAHLYNV